MSRLAFSRETANVAENFGLPEDRKKVDEVIAALKIHVAGSVKETVESRNFRERKQHTRESFDNYVIALRELIKACNYCIDECSRKASRVAFGIFIYQIKIVNQTKEKEAPDSSFALIRALQCCISFFSRESNSSIPDVDGFH